MLCRVIYPEENHDILKCSCCELTYTAREYKILKNVDKLGYFYSEEYGYFCHLCLMEYIEINRKSGENLPIIIKTKDSQVKL